MADGGLTKTDSVTSVTSFTSDMLEDEEVAVELGDQVEYDSAPYDIAYHHPGTGQIIIAKEGVLLPHMSNYYKIKDGTLAVKFEVSKLLEVSVAAEREIKKKTVSTKIINIPTTPISFDASFPSAVAGASESISSDTGAADMLQRRAKNFREPTAEEAGEEETEIGGGRKFKSSGEFLASIDNKFEKVVVGGMEAGIRKSVKEKLKNKIKLAPKENISIIHALNQVVFDEYGSMRPDPKLCQMLSEILKEKFPQTFRVGEVVQSSFGPLKLKKSKGEGGYSDLAKRIGDNFYNQHTKKAIKRPVLGVDGSQEGSSASPGGKKPKKAMESLQRITTLA